MDTSDLEPTEEIQHDVEPAPKEESPKAEGLPEEEHKDDHDFVDVERDEGGTTHDAEDD